MAIRPTPGRSLITRRAVADIVRTATLGSYGVTGFAAGPVAHLAATVGMGHAGLSVRLRRGIHIELDLTVALGVPIAEVARQVDSAVRYAVRQALGQEVARLVIHIDGLRVQPGTAPHDVGQSGSSGRGPSGMPTPDLAESGTDVA